MKELMLKKCEKCGAIVEVLNDCTCKDCGIKCCGNNMQTITPSADETKFEKHKPVVERMGNYVVASVNHVMEQEHYINYLFMVADGIVGKKILKPGETPKAVFPYVKGSKIYEYCNLHGLFSTDVE